MAFVSPLGAETYAQDVPKFAGFAGYSYVRENPAASGIGSLRRMAAALRSPTMPLFGSAQSASSAAITPTIFLAPELTGRFPLIFSARAFASATIRGLLRSANALFGVAHIGGHRGLGFSSSNNSFAMAIGGGVDFKVADRFSVRPLQVEYLPTRFNELGLGAQNQNNLRVFTRVLHF
jgi:hypothetical protein